MRGRDGLGCRTVLGTRGARRARWLVKGGRLWRDGVTGAKGIEFGGLLGGRRMGGRAAWR